MLTGKIYDSTTPSSPLHKPRVGKPFVMSERYEDILEAVHYYRYVRSADITRLFYQSSSSNHVREKLALLAGQNKDYPGLKYLYRFPLPTTRIGQTEYIYTLGSAGRRYMRNLGADVSWHFRPAKYPHADSEAVYEEIGISYSQLKHDVLVTSFLVAAVSFGRASEEWSLQKQNIQYGLKQEITKLCTSEEHKAWLRYAVPDGFLDFQHDRKKIRVPVLVEIDRAREYKTAFKQRIRGLVFFIESGIYKKALCNTPPIISFATIGGDSRLENMRVWTKEVLQELRKKPLRRAFYFRRLQSSWEHDAYKLLCGSHWFSVGHKTPSPLLG